MPPSPNTPPPALDNGYPRDDEIDLIELGAGIWAQRKLVAAITAAITALALLYALLATPSYEATADLRPQSASAIAELTENDLLPITPLSAFGRMLSELRADSIQQRAVDEILGDNSISDLDKVFAVNASTEPQRINGDMVEQYTHATVTAKHASPETAAFLANTLVEFANNTTADSLVRELHSTAAARLTNLERDIERRRDGTRKDTEIRIAQLEESDAISRGRLEDRIRELRATARKLREDELTRLREALSIARQLGITEPRSNEFQNIVNIDTSSGMLRADRSANLPLYALGTNWLQAEITALEAREGDVHDVPEIRQLEQQLAELEVNRQIEALRKREDFTPFVQGISELLSERSRLEAAMQSEFPNLSVVRIDRVALPPESPVAPRRALIVVLGVMLGGMLGVFVALIMNAVQARRTVESDPA